MYVHMYALYMYIYIHIYVYIYGTETKEVPGASSSKNLRSGSELARGLSPFGLLTVMLGTEGGVSHMDYYRDSIRASMETAVGITSGLS